MVLARAEPCERVLKTSVGVLGKYTKNKLFYPTYNVL